MTKEEHTAFRDLWHAANDLRIQVDLDRGKDHATEQASDRLFHALGTAREHLEIYELNDPDYVPF